MKLLCWASLKMASDLLNSSIVLTTSELDLVNFSQSTYAFYPTVSRIESKFFYTVAISTWLMYVENDNFIKILTMIK